MTHRDAFVRSICENPADDVPRLVFADWLDDHGEPERAEFIRLQCELARGPFGFAKEIDIPDHRDNPLKRQWRNQVLRLSRRERELLAVPTVRPETGDLDLPLWIPWSVPCHAGYCLNLYDGKPHPASIAIIFRRGFVAEVRCTRQQWIDNGAKIVRQQPVETLVLTDAESQLDEQHAYQWWFDYGNRHRLRCERSYVPRRWAEDYYGTAAHPGPGVDATTRSQAKTIMERVALNVARREANLPPLHLPTPGIAPA